MAWAEPNPDASLLEQQAQAWLLRIKSGQATPSDLQALRRWCASSAAHARAFENARRVWDEIGQVGAMYRAAHPAQSAHPARAAAQAMRPARRVFLGAAFSAAGAAAVAAMVYPPLGLWPSVFELNSDYRTATGEQRSIELAGRIRIDLNTQSSLSARVVQRGAAVEAGTAQMGRDEIELIAGEAAIASDSASTGRTLDVVAGSGRTVLSSGEIEVRLLGDRACITCVRGEVEVHHPARTVALRAGEQVNYDRQGIAVAAAVDPVQVSAWRQGALVFRDSSLVEVVAEINRYRPGRVILLDRRLGERKVSGKFQIARLDLAIDRIEDAFGARVRRLPGEVILLG